MNLAFWLERAGKSHGTQPAIGLGDRVVRNYGELAGRAAKLAAALRQDFRLQPGDRVAIAAQNSVYYLEVLYAIWHAGLCAVPANAKLHGTELGYILEHSQAKACFVSSDIEAAVAAHAPATLERLVTIGGAEYEALFQTDAIPITLRLPDDLAWLFYTSGTTGRPKGAMLPHRALYRTSHAYASEVDPIAPGDAILHAAPMSHGSGLYIMAHVARLGINVVPESGGFEPDEIFQLIARMAATPRCSPRRRWSSAWSIARAECDPANIRTMIYGGAPMYVEDALEALERFGPRLAQIYGQGESPMTITTLVETGHRRPRASALAGSARLGRPAICVPRRDGRRRAGSRIARGRDRRNPVPRRRRDVGLLAQPGGDRADHCAAAGCIPATSARSTPTAISRSRTAPRT